MYSSQEVSYSYGIGDWGLPAIVRGEGNHILACARRPVAKLMRLLPVKYLEAMEHNQKIAHCCRHPENHEVEAWFSSEGDRKKGVPDIYKFHCTCGRTHVRFCVGGGEKRPFWEVR